MLAEGGGDRKAWGRALDCLAAGGIRASPASSTSLSPVHPDSARPICSSSTSTRDKARAEFIAGIERMLAQRIS
jgi:hypothetical protein